jgi:hypothetical protein
MGIGHQEPPRVAGRLAHTSVAMPPLASRNKATALALAAKSATAAASGRHRRRACVQQAATSALEAVKASAVRRAAGKRAGKSMIHCQRAELRSAAATLKSSAAACPRQASRADQRAAPAERQQRTAEAAARSVATPSAFSSGRPRSCDCVSAARRPLGKTARPQPAAGSYRARSAPPGPNA